MWNVIWRTVCYADLVESKAAVPVSIMKSASCAIAVSGLIRVEVKSIFSNNNDYSSHREHYQGPGDNDSQSNDYDTGNHNGYH